MTDSSKTGASPAHKVLIVDDEPDVVRYLEMILSDHGFATMVATDGREALEAARRERPALVTLDVSMPEVSGTRFYKEFKSDPELKDVPVIIITAVTGLGDDKDAYRRFISGRRSVPAPEGFLCKPIDRGAFLDAVRALMPAA